LFYVCIVIRFHQLKKGYKKQVLWFALPKLSYRKQQIRTKPFRKGFAQKCFWVHLNEKGVHKEGKGVQKEGKGVHLAKKGVQKEGKGVHLVKKGVQKEGKRVHLVKKGVQKEGKGVHLAKKGVQKEGKGVHLVKKEFKKREKKFIWTVRIGNNKLKIKTIQKITKTTIKCHKKTQKCWRIS